MCMQRYYCQILVSTQLYLVTSTYIRTACLLSSERFKRDSRNLVCLNYDFFLKSEKTRKQKSSKSNCLAFYFSRNALYIQRCVSGECKINFCVTSELQLILHGVSYFFVLKRDHICWILTFKLVSLPTGCTQGCQVGCVSFDSPTLINEL